MFGSAGDRAGDRQDPSGNPLLIGLVLGLALFRELACRMDSLYSQKTGNARRHRGPWHRSNDVGVSNPHPFKSSQLVL